MKQEEIDSPLFPKYIVGAGHCRIIKQLNGSSKIVFKSRDATAVLTENIAGHILISHTKANVIKWNGQEMTFTIIERNNDNDWAIMGRPYNPHEDDSDYENEEEEIDEVTDFELELWKCPYSSNLKKPPKEPWVPVDELARGKSKIEHL